VLLRERDGHFETCVAHQAVNDASFAQSTCNVMSQLMGRERAGALE